MLKPYKTHKRTIATLAIGECIAHETQMKCTSCQKIFQSESLRTLAPHKCKFGFDIIVYVGMALFQDNKSESSIQEDLNQRNIAISLREIGYLGKKFIVYLALAQKESQGKIKTYMQSLGGYILHLDGTCEGGSPHLMSSMDEISQFVIGNVKIPSENSKYITPFLSNIKTAYGEPLALVHDMGGGIIKSVEKVFPGVPDYICHYHFLRDIGKDLFDRQYQMLARYLKDTGVRNELRALARDIQAKIEASTELKQCLEKYLSLDDLKKPFIQFKPEVKIYLLVTWILESSSESNGYGFPFDRPHLDFYRRAQRAYTHIMKAKKNLFEKNGGKLPTKKLTKSLNDLGIKNIAAILKERITMFDKLRDAMRIALPIDNKGLNDDGNDENISLIKLAVSQFRNSDKLQALAMNHLCYQKMIKQIDKYWDKLFCEPIEVTTDSGTYSLQPQRTNNMMERLFRNEKQAWRQKSGAHKLSRKLKAILADTLLVRNLNKPNYLSIILNGNQTLEGRFAEIDIQQVRDTLNKKNNLELKYPRGMNKVFKLPDLPKILSKKSKKVVEF